MVRRRLLELVALVQMKLEKTWIKYCILSLLIFLLCGMVWNWMIRNAQCMELSCPWCVIYQHIARSLPASATMGVEHAESVTRFVVFQKIGNDSVYWLFDPSFFVCLLCDCVCLCRLSASMFRWFLLLLSVSYCFFSFAVLFACVLLLGTVLLWIRRKDNLFALVWWIGLAIVVNCDQMLRCVTQPNVFWNARVKQKQNDLQNRTSFDILFS